MAAGKIADEAKDGLSEAEIKAAQSNPPGDTELSGAAPGAKADAAPDAIEAYDKPKAQVAAEKAALKTADAVRDLQVRAQTTNLLTNVPEYPTSVAYANRPEKGDTPSVTFVVTPGVLTITTTANKLEFNREEAAGFQRAVNRVAGQL
jgi:hypothetical protein